MSLYLGTSTTGKKILHITSSEDSINAMRNNTPINSTVFHSELPYLQPKKYPCQIHKQLYSTAVTPYMYQHYIKPSDEAINLISNGYEYIIVARSLNSNNEWFSVSTVVETGVWDLSASGSQDKPYMSNMVWGPIPPFSSLTSGTSSTPNSTNKWVLVYNKSTIGLSTGIFNLPNVVFNPYDDVYEAYILILNIKNEILANPIGSIPSLKNEVFLSPQAFSISNGERFLDLANFTHLKQVNVYSHSNGFKSVNGGVGYFAFELDVSNVVGWRVLPSTIDSSYTIEKKYNNNIYKKVFDSTVPLSIYKGVENIGIQDISIGGGATYEANISSIENNGFFYGILTGYFWSSVGGGTRPFRVALPIKTYLDNAYSLIILDDSYSFVNGVNKHSVVFLWIGVFSGTIKIKVEHRKGYAGGGGYNSFSLSGLNLKILKFYTNKII